MIFEFGFNQKQFGISEVYIILFFYDFGIKSMKNEI